MVPGLAAAGGHIASGSRPGQVGYLALIWRSLVHAGQVQSTLASSSLRVRTLCTRAPVLAGVTPRPPTPAGYPLSLTPRPPALRPPSRRPLDRQQNPPAR